MAQTVRLKYETNNGSIFFVKMDGRVAVTDIAGAQPTGAATENMTVYAGKNAAKYGIRARQILFGRLVGSAGVNADGYVTAGRAYKRVPILTKAVWDAVVEGAIGGSGVTELTVGSTTFYALKKIDEDID